MDERSTAIARRFEVPILVAALLVIPVIVIEQSNVGHGWKTMGSMLNWLIWAAFAVEVVVMTAVVPKKRRWLREHPLEVVIVFLTAPFLPASLQAMRAFRLLRVVRLLRLARLARQLFSLQGLRYVALLAALTALGGGAGYAAVENHSTWDGVWWAVVTMTTVGYGDLPVVTVGGRLIGIAIMLVGIGFIAILTGAVAQRFLVPQFEEVSELEAETASGIELAEADILTEIREIGARLRQLESRLERRATT
jgi:voltage-gated potassium channel